MHRIFLPLLFVLTMPTLVFADFDHSCSEQRFENAKRHQRERNHRTHVGMAAVAFPRVTQLLFNYARYKRFISPAMVERAYRWTPFAYPIDVALSAAGLYGMSESQPHFPDEIFDVVLTYALDEADEAQNSVFTHELTTYLNHLLYPEFPAPAILKHPNVNVEDIRKEFIVALGAHVFTDDDVNSVLSSLIDRGVTCRTSKSSPKLWTKAILRTYLEQRK